MPVVAVAARLVAGFLALLAASDSVRCGPASVRRPGGSAQRQQPVSDDLRVAITKVGNGDDAGDGTIQPDHKLVVHGTVTNPGSTHWLDAQAYLQITPDPAKSLADLQ